MKLAVGLLLISTSTVVPAAELGRALTIEQRVRAQRAIEQVYWNHRIWPQENPGPKPPLSAEISDREIRAMVADYLRKSNATAAWWQRPITGDQLQAELDRMARDSRDGKMLQELYRALGNDPLVIAETLARPALVDRLIRNWFANDTRFHGELKSRVKAALAQCAKVDCMKSMGGTYRETTFRLRSERDDAGAQLRQDAAVELDSAEWSDQLDRLAEQWSTTPQALPVGRVSRLQETDEAFIVTALLARRDGELVTATVAWPKRTFEAWWNEARDAVADVIDEPRAVYALPTVPSSDCTNDAWTPTGLATPDLRAEHTAVWTGSEMIFWGGLKTGAMNTGGRYNPATDTWSATSTGANVPSKRYRHTAVWTGTEMIVWGGSSGGQGNPETNSGGRYSPATDSWLATTTAGSDPAARYLHNAVWTGTSMIVWGGQNNSCTPFACHPAALNTGGQYSPASDSWTGTSTGANVPVARWAHTGVWTGTEMIVWGGLTNEAGQILDNGGRYDPSSDTWLPVARVGDYADARDRHTAVWTGTEMIIWGGVSAQGGIYPWGSRYNPLTDTWTLMSTGANSPAARYMHTAVWTGAEMIIWGGITASSAVNTGARYNPSNDTWIGTSTGTNDPAARSSHAAVWTGTEMIVWGGVANSGYINSGGRYNPSTNGWTPTASRPDVPAGRKSHVSVWTGTEMIVWGGVVFSNVLNTGGRYNPAIDTWAATSTGPNVPAARQSAGAVWTGTELIVWGGGPTGGSTNTGGRYNPTTDTWRATATGASAPAARSYHSDVWTGTEMIVWGGLGAGSNLNTGGRYNPTTDTWSATAISPTARYLHSTVWTGTEMIVWGGYIGGGTSLNTGGRYDPSTDSWTATSTGANTPLARFGHTAVWTGSEMIVWGGSAGGIYLDTGGRYKPSNDKWVATAISPAGRWLHSAVWTGAEMIVWGGTMANGSGAVNSGGRYNAAGNGWTPTAIDGDTPSARSDHRGVWTGSEMIVWGGEPTTQLGGRYCACPTGQIYYRDADEDGFGNAADSLSVCDGTLPPGYIADGTDCDDAIAAVHPNAAEINDGIDNQCPGVTGYGETDEISGMSGFTSPGDKTRLAWSAQSGATSYDVARSATGDFSAGCTVFSTGSAFIVDPETPPADGAFYYLVRAAAPHVGGWGLGIGGAERTVSCALARGLACLFRLHNS